MSWFCWSLSCLGRIMPLKIPRGRAALATRRVLVEMAKTTMVTMDAFMGGRKVCTVSRVSSRVRRACPRRSGGGSLRVLQARVPVLSAVRRMAA